MKFLNYYILCSCILVYMPNLFACDKKIEQNGNGQEETSMSDTLKCLSFLPSLRAIPVNKHTQLPLQSAIIMDLFCTKPLRGAERTYTHHKNIEERQRKQREGKQKNSMKKVSSKKTWFATFGSASSQVDWHQLRKDDLRVIKEIEQDLQQQYQSNLSCSLL